MLSRRKFLRRFFYGASGIAAAGIASVAYGSLLERYNLKIEHIEVPVDTLAPGQDGIRIVHLSDLHIDPFTGRSFLEKVVATANELKPDLVALTGDFVTDDAEAIFDLAPILAELKASFGVYSCLGNHDVWSSKKIITQGLKDIGLPVFCNEGQLLSVKNSPLFIAGLEDAWAGKPDISLALEDAPDNIPVIVLMHEPDLIDTVSQDRRVSLQLSGHSHGGQIRIPGFGAPILPYLGQKYPRGLYKVNESWLYTSRGIGVVGVPARFNCRPELSCITLRKP